MAVATWLGAVQGLSPMEEDCRERGKGLAVFVEFLLGLQNLRL